MTVVGPLYTVIGGVWGPRELGARAAGAAHTRGEVRWSDEGEDDAGGERESDERYAWGW